MTSDPIGLGGGLNTFGYVGGNPVKYFDIFGLRFPTAPEFNIIPTRGNLTFQMNNSGLHDALNNAPDIRIEWGNPLPQFPPQAIPVPLPDNFFTDRIRGFSDEGNSCVAPPTGLESNILIGPMR